MGLLGLIGGAAGAFLGGPAGFAAGMGLGSNLEGMTQTNNQPQSPVRVTGGVADVGEGVISRRLRNLDQSEPLQIASAIDSLKYIKDDATRSTLAEPLMKAKYISDLKYKQEGGFNGDNVG